MVETEAVREELKQVRADIKDLKSEFLKKKEEKEAHFSKGEEVSKQIDSIYEEVKAIEDKHNLDKINEDLEEKKKELEVQKADLELVEEKFNEVKKKSRKPQAPTRRRVPKDKIEGELKSLDLKLQTQVLSLDQEQDLIKKISELKEQLKGSTQGSSVHSDDPEFKAAKKDLNAARRKVSNTERKIRSLYKQIRLISKEKKLKYKEIDQLRDDKKKSFEDFREYKGEYSDLGKKLKDLFKREDELMTELGETPKPRRTGGRRGNNGPSEAKMKERQQEAEDKLMKKGEVLTTEDLLMLQSRK